MARFIGLRDQTKEAAGWQVRTCEVDGVHLAEFTTPTGAHYHSTAPPPPGPLAITISEIEAAISIDLLRLHAA